MMLVVLLHPDLVSFVREHARAGGYRDEADVLAEALFLLWQRDCAEPDGRAASPAEAA